MAQYVSILDKVRAKLRKQPLATTYSEAVRWYRDQIKKLAGGAGMRHGDKASGELRNHLLSDPKRSRTKYFPGMMYLFVYDAKHKKTLPYWDKFPLVFFIGPVEDGTWLGINFHYLNYQQRLLLLHELITLANNHLMNPNAKLIMTYETLKRYARFKAFKPCLHKYLPDHIMSNMVKIEAPDWETALFLPVENFAKRSKTFVWADSERIIAGTQKGPTPLTAKVVRTQVVNQNGLPSKEK